MKTLQLGCGIRPMPDAINHDRYQHADFVDVGWDLNLTPWPWQDGEFERIVALDVMEHLTIDVKTWLDECWRILQPNGLLVLRLPAWDNPVSYRDPTHRKVFQEETFNFWDKRSPLYHDYGSFYFRESNKWWNIETVERTNGGDIGFVLRKQVD